ncbi:signal peptidase [Streptomyces albus]|uniref:Signal peptidase I n=1 Tax=Streptomyces albus (strain ATCC 21838 / DSM 41398 / FERM P-419 / JCM 4703 / NBRC 107858) TaxID=1081613 RepID=A0A0B5EKF9_STRA4|nr:signal peptidase [Streptomyces albus]AOU76332.1 signal peptidase [Streptomyces albus]AYN32117.1 signal peptidase I [Streptomyces albus]
MGKRGIPRGEHRAGDDQEERPATGGRAERRKLARKVKRRRRRSAIKEIPLLVGVALIIALVLKTFLVQAFVIPSGSMEQTIKVGDRVLVDKLTPWFGSKPERGDVVVFKDPGDWLEAERKKKKDPPVGVKQIKWALTNIGLLPSDDERDLIKRVVGVGGDTVKCCDKQGRVTVNGTPLNEPYLHPGNKPSDFSFTVKVPEGRLFVLGDHRADSADSRYHRTEAFNGTVSEDSVVGRALVIAWPFGHWRGLTETKTYASVPDAAAVAAGAPTVSHRVDAAERNGMIPLPIPAELPLVMGVVGLRLTWNRHRHGLRSGCGGFGGRRTIRTRGPRGAAREPAGPIRHTPSDRAGRAEPDR